MITLHHLYLSPGHNYYGHHGKPAGEHPIIETETLGLVAGKGIVDDRFFDYKPDYKGQITFFDYELHQAVKAEFNLPDLAPSAYRRNTLVSGTNILDLIGKEFSIGELRFIGHSECTPCYWMDQACAPGTEDFLKGRGGLRAKIIQGGTLTRGTHPLTVHT